MLRNNPIQVVPNKLALAEVGEKSLFKLDKSCWFHFGLLMLLSDNVAFMASPASGLARRAYNDQNSFMGRRDRIYPDLSGRFIIWEILIPA